jgi:hypothetical protein
MTLPNLVIAGAPKCGTSSLFDWLVAHPQVCGSTVKEPFFLIDEGNPLRNYNCNFHDHGLGAYASFFAHCRGNEKVIAEATTHYIYQHTALDVLATLPSRPRVVFVLRKPSERILSSFAFSKHNLGNVRADLSFAEFVRRASNEPEEPGLQAALGRSAYVLVRDLQYSRYVDYLLAWRERLGEDRMRILLFESMRLDPKRVMEGFASWLGIDPSFYAGFDFTPRNKTVSVRSGKVQRLARAFAGNIPAGPVKDSLKRVYLVLQSKPPQPASEADEETLATLEDDFRPHNRRLANEFNLDLSAWETPAPHE